MRFALAIGTGTLSGTTIRSHLCCIRLSGSSHFTLFTHRNPRSGSRSSPSFLPSYLAKEGRDISGSFRSQQWFIVNASIHSKACREQTYVRVCVCICICLHMDCGSQLLSRWRMVPTHQPVLSISRNSPDKKKKKKRTEAYKHTLLSSPKFPLRFARCSKIQ